VVPSCSVLAAICHKRHVEEEYRSKCNEEKKVEYLVYVEAVLGEVLETAF